MDPDATWKILHDVDNPPKERAAAAEHLLTWMHGGGFHPTAAVSRRQALQRCHSYLSGEWT